MISSSSPQKGNPHGRLIAHIRPLYQCNCDPFSPWHYFVSFNICIIVQKDRIPSVYASLCPLTSLWTWGEIITDFFFNKSLILTSDTGNICRPKVKHETREGEQLSSRQHESETHRNAKGQIRQQESACKQSCSERR